VGGYGGELVKQTKGTADDVLKYASMRTNAHDLPESARCLKDRMEVGKCVMRSHEVLDYLLRQVPTDKANHTSCARTKRLDAVKVTLFTMLGNGGTMLMNKQSQGEIASLIMFCRNEVHYSIPLSCSCKKKVQSRDSCPQDCKKENV
jgi:hypothetical protein